MASQFKFLALFLFLLAVSCGDAGVGFNVSRRVPVMFDIFVPGNDPSIQTNFPSFTEPFRLKDVGTFENVLSDLAENDGVVINAITYAIGNVSDEERAAVDGISLNVSSSTGEEVNELDVSGTLQSTPETTTGIDDDGVAVIEGLLTNNKEVDNTVIFDFAELPTSDLAFTLIIYYDVTLRVRY